MRVSLLKGLAAAAAVAAVLEAVADVPLYTATTLAEYPSPGARQGVAVDAGHFYAIDNVRITRHEKVTGVPVRQWDGVSDETGPLIHLDSGVVYAGKVYAAHSNYPRWPMTSSVEIWNAETLEHVGSHSFGIAIGSFTWLDRYDDMWWGTFANYDKVQPKEQHSYGETRNTQLVQMDDRFTILQQWTFPEPLLRRFTPMSNSGGSWGDDGLLYVTGHDRGEIYVLRLPAYGSELDWIATVAASDIEGQGIAWDRSASSRILWGILKRDRKVVKMRIPEITPSPRSGPATIRIRDFED